MLKGGEVILGVGNNVNKGSSRSLEEQGDPPVKRNGQREIQ